MEEYRQTLRRRLAVAGVYNAAIVAVIILGLTLGRKLALNDTALCFATGFLVGLQFVLIFFMRKYHVAIRNEERRRALYIEENDERRGYIAARVGGMGINVVISGLALAMVAAAFVNQVAFLTLLSALLFSVLVKGALKIYYNRAV